ncbi:MAG: type II toxin-antitoxin system Phd/YefM family antitoxin [Clostridiales bacterium]|nr:type II toxin-antitoxin system Phd/YefM family antitoxin [Clostridiales bacterium]
MKASADRLEYNYKLLNFAEHLVPVSDFSRGKTAKIFDDVKKNNAEYVVLKNNQPAAMVISMVSYKALVEKAIKMERLLDETEEKRLSALAEQRLNNSKDFIDHKDICAEFGFTPEEIEEDCESVEIE